MTGLAVLTAAGHLACLALSRDEAAGDEAAGAYIHGLLAGAYIHGLLAIRQDFFEPARAQRATLSSR